MEHLYIIALIASILNIIMSIVTKNISGTLGWFTASCWLSIIILEGG